MTYPSEKIHRVSRRRLPRGQHATPEPVTINVMGSGSTVTLHFSSPVNIAGPTNFALAGHTQVSQTIVNPQTIRILYTAPLGASAWTMPTPPANITSRTGAPVLGGTGETMIDPNDVLHSAGGNYYPPSTANVRNGVQFGVSNTGSTGSYNPALAPTINPTSVHNNGDGTYQLIFPEDVTLNSVAIDTGISLYSPSGLFGGPGWTQVQTVAQNASNAVIVQHQNGATDCTYMLFNDVPSTITLVNAAHSFKNAPTTSMT